jgi:hypothetical protein
LAICQAHIVFWKRLESSSRGLFGSPKKFKRLIVDSATGRFFAPGGKWTFNEEEALDFDDTMSAIAASATLSVKTAEVLFRFREGNEFDIRLPLPDEGRSQEATGTSKDRPE